MGLINQSLSERSFDNLQSAKRHNQPTVPTNKTQMSHKFILLQRQRMLTCLSYEIRAEALVNQLKLHQLVERGKKKKRKKNYFNLSEG